MEGVVAVVVVVVGIIPWGVQIHLLYKLDILLTVHHIISV
jgi:hypothetical protein